jgi:sugar phosphate isomerase/epimerase
LAEGYGVLVVIEMICISNIRDLKTAAAIVGDTWQRNGGLALDIWHFARGGVPYKDIAALPPGSIRWVELDDGDAEQKGDMLDEQIDHRRLCGKGGFDIPGFLQALNTAGYHGPYGVEIISEELRALPLDTVARLTFDSAAQYFNRKVA